MMLWMLLALSVGKLIQPRLALGPTLSLLDSMQPWTSSANMEGRVGSNTLNWQAQGAGPHTASRGIPLAPESEFIAVRSCTHGGLAPGVAEVFLASVRHGQLDFNRQYSLNMIYGNPTGECREEAFPRRPGDGLALLQIQLPEAAGAAWTTLTVTPLKENPVWRWTRLGMLAMGLMLLTWSLKPYLALQPWYLSWMGLLVVSGILFGCCVSVSLKADIYELITGGRVLSATRPVEELLLLAFPIGGFSIFTYLHAVFFAGAAFFLGLCYRQAWTDLLLLAMVTEMLQVFVPGRGPGVSDMLVDWSGVALGTLLVVLLRRSQRVRLFLQQQGVDKNAPGF